MLTLAFAYLLFPPNVGNVFQIPKVKFLESTSQQERPLTPPCSFWKQPRRRERGVSGAAGTEGPEDILGRKDRKSLEWVGGVKTSSLFASCSSLWQGIRMLKSTSCQYALSFERIAAEIFNTAMKWKPENIWGMNRSFVKSGLSFVMCFYWGFFFLAVFAQTYTPPWHGDGEKQSVGVRIPGLQKAPQNPTPPRPILSVWTQPDRRHWIDKAEKIFIKLHFLHAHLLPSINLPPQTASSRSLASPPLSVGWYRRTGSHDPSTRPE